MISQTKTVHYASVSKLNRNSFRRVYDMQEPAIDIKEEPMEADDEENVEQWIKINTLYKTAEAAKPTNPPAVTTETEFRIVDEKRDIITITAVDSKSEDEIMFMERLNSRGKTIPGILRAAPALKGSNFHATCPKCQQLFNSRIMYTKHLEAGVCFIFENAKRCALCPLTFKLNKDLQHHLELHRQNRFFCNKYCGVSFDTLQLCEHHEIHQHLVRDIKCYICLHKFRTYNFLVDHRKIHSKLKHVVCSYCRGWFANHHEMVEHWQQAPNKCGLLLKSSRQLLEYERKRSNDDSEPSHCVGNRESKRCRKQKHVERKIDDDDVTAAPFGSEIIVPPPADSAVAIKKEPMEEGEEPAHTAYSGMASSWQTISVPPILEPEVCIKTEPDDEWDSQLDANTTAAEAVAQPAMPTLTEPPAMPTLSASPAMPALTASPAMPALTAPPGACQQQQQQHTARLAFQEQNSVKQCVTLAPQLSDITISPIVGQLLNMPGNLRLVRLPANLQITTHAAGEAPPLPLQPMNQSVGVRVVQMPPNLMLLRLPGGATAEPLPAIPPATQPPPLINTSLPRKAPPLQFRFVNSPMVQMPPPTTAAAPAVVAPAIVAAAAVAPAAVAPAEHANVRVVTKITNMQDLKRFVAIAKKKGDAERKLCCIPKELLEAINCLPEQRQVIDSMLQQIKEATDKRPITMKKTIASSSASTTAGNSFAVETGSGTVTSAQPQGHFIGHSEDSVDSTNTDSSSATTTTSSNSVQPGAATAKLDRVHNAASSKSRSHQFDCPDCGHFCSSRTILNDHLRSDCSRVRRYPCATCGKSFFSASTLRTHITIHTGELPFKCKFCDQHFRTTGQVSVHQRRHTGERPFQCQVCSQSFTHRETLISHLSRHIGMKRYKCYGCQKQFSCISGLTTHREHRPSTCGKVALNSRAVGPRVRVVRGNVFFEPQPDINPYLRTPDPEVLAEIQNTNDNNN